MKHSHKLIIAAGFSCTVVGLALPGVALADSHDAVCVITNNGVSNFLAISGTDDCSDYVSVPAVGGVSFGDIGDKIIVGPSGSQTTLNADGSATFGGGATFNSGTQFNGNVAFIGSVQANQINTGSITNSGGISTSSLNTGSFHASGNGTFAGSLSADSFYANSATIATLHVPGAATFNSTVTVGGKLTASQGLVVGAGATIDAGGNRIQNVGAPIAGTDAANKDYVDNAVSGVQGGIATLNTRVTDHETRLTAAEATNTVQDTRLTAVENTDTVQDTRLTTVENTNTVQDSRLTSVEAKNVSQDSRMTAIESVNATQSQQIGTLQDQVGDLQTSVNGLRKDIKGANAGIAAAVALGGTMVVPDSNLSISFNLATYRGQQGFSGSVVGRVGPKVYVNAGIGGSTVRGSTAGRVGISFGL